MKPPTRELILASINDYWDASVWRDLFTQLINMRIQVILSILQGNYRNEIGSLTAFRIWPWSWEITWRAVFF